MNCNIGKKDKAVRIVLAIVFLALALSYNIWFLLLAVIAFFTAIFKFCLLYKFLGINTCKEEAQKEKEDGSEDENIAEQTDNKQEDMSENVSDEEGDNDGGENETSDENKDN